MKVSIVGAGPAGLYLAILLKKANAGHEVEILERNAPDATFGWGVVFSEETLGALRDADYQTYVEITDSFARWSTVDIRYRDKIIRSGGNRFSAIKRTHLLEILQRRCRELGVELSFGVEVDHLPDGDLIVAADGSNSLLRNNGEFGTSVKPQGCKYVWFGTDLVLDAFTFIFRETEHGLFQVHAYPFDEHLSTWIVECPEPVWRSAGLDTMSEQESLEFCEKLCAPDLAGHRLLSNKSIWLSFPLVRNISTTLPWCQLMLRTKGKLSQMDRLLSNKSIWLSFPLVRNISWHQGNVVLIGDAAHTAHFSIGSGTKLAMEDAIALANAFIRHPDNTEAALTDYELERQPVVERFQQAAGDSAAYFGRVANYTKLEPIQFATNLLTRSGRISHTNLMQRDPDFVRVLDAWFAGATEPGSFAPPPAFVPLRLPGLYTRNRVVSTTYGTGAGLVLTPMVAPTPDGRVSKDSPTIDDDWAPVVNRAHDAGALIGIRLGHAGPRAGMLPSAKGRDIPLRDNEWQPIAASAVRYGPFGPTPKAMEADDLERVRAAFADAASKAAEAGFDLLELDLSDGYLLASFLSPLTNKGADKDYPLSIVDTVRDAWPSERLLSTRLTVTDWAKGGNTIEDGIVLARRMAEHGAGLIHVRAGQTTANARPEYGRGFLTTLSDRVRNEAGVPTLVGGYLTTVDEVNTIVAAGRADLCVLDLPRTELEKTVFNA